MAEKCLRENAGEPLEIGAKRNKKKKAPAAWLLLKRGNSAIIKKKPMRFQPHSIQFSVVLIFKQKMHYFCDFLKIK